MTSSGSDIIKAIVMGKKKKENKMDEKQHFENGTETYESLVNIMDVIQLQIMGIHL